MSPEATSKSLAKDSSARAHENGRGDEDRRRIKERLREAVERSSGRGPELDVAGVVERVFGICEADFKRAKAGSRSDLPYPFSS